MLKWSKVKAEIIYLKEVRQGEGMMMNTGALERAELSETPHKAQPVGKIADYILKYGDGLGYDFDGLQLLKLAYIAHGFHLGVYGTPLFAEKVEAWQYGPVIPELYHAYKHYGRQKIFDIPVDAGRGLHLSAIDSIEAAVDVYGDMPGIRLSALTHKDGTPWAEIYRPGRKNIEISNNVIRDYYVSWFARLKSHNTS